MSSPPAPRPERRSFIAFGLGRLAGFAPGAPAGEARGGPPAFDAAALRRLLGRLRGPARLGPG